VISLRAEGGERLLALINDPPELGSGIVNFELKAIGL
jgi:hypothetical protein